MRRVHHWRQLGKRQFGTSQLAGSAWRMTLAIWDFIVIPQSSVSASF